ncbi:MAG: acetate--CoA ligase family protein [Candidatus Geothermincolia bacterium]
MAGTNNLKDFFEPGSVAVVGASRAAGKGGNTILANILEFGFGGRIYPINPSAGEILGLRVYPTLADLPGPPDLVIAVLPRAQTVELMAECASAGVRSVIIPAAGFSDAGEEGRRLERDVMEVAREAKMRVMGPNSIGTVNTGSGLATSIVTLDRLKPGGISVFGQTGMFASGIARWINTSEHFGIRKIACLGNKGDIDENDLLEHLAADPGTRVVGMYTEGVRDGARFSSVLKRASSSKPVLILKSGRSETGRRAIASHTGAMAGSESIYSGAIEQAGALRVEDFDEMFDCAKAFDALPLPRGNRVGIVSITGVGCVLSADAAGRYGLELPELQPGTVARMREVLPEWAPAANPADVWAGIEGGGAEATYNGVAPALARDPSIDMLVAIFTLIPESSLDAAGMFASLRQEFPEMPMAAVLMAGEAEMHLEWKRSIEGAGVPTYTSPERAMRALGAMAKYARICRK